MIMSLRPAFCLVLFTVACGGASSRVPPPVYVPESPAGAAVQQGPAVPPVYLHVQAREGAVVQVLSTVDSEWKDVCQVPCDGYVPAYGSYRVLLRRLPPSAEFTLPAEPGATAQFTLPGPPGTSVGLAVDDSGRVWTTDSVQLEARRRQAAVVPVFLR